MKPEKFTAREDMRQIIEQKLGMAEMQSALIDEIRQNHDNTDKNRLWSIAYKFLDAYKMPEKDRIETATIIDRYLDRHNSMRELRKQHPDNEGLFTALIGYEPKGEIEIIDTPAAFYIRCQSPLDFTLIASGRFRTDGQITEEDIDSYKVAAAVNTDRARQENLNGAIIAENWPLVGREINKPLFDHEEEHAIQQLFWVDYRLINFSGHEKITDASLAKKMVELYLRFCRKNFIDLNVKREILGYIKSGWSAKEIYQELTKLKHEGGIYDYQTLEEGNIIREAMDWDPIFQNVLTKELVDKIFRDEYWKLVAESCHAFEILTKELGYPIDETANLFRVEPLSKWKRLATRIKEYAKE